MRYLLLLLPLAAAGCAGTYPVGTGYGYPASSPTYASGYGYYGQYQPSYGHGYGATNEYGQVQGYDTENCGTPYEFKACPPMPRRPLPYYPANRS